MRNKWYISALIFALVIFGISLKQTSVPNQEIVLQFTDVEVSLLESQKAITLVKNQLRGVGADNIKIQDVGSGTLKITYYSDLATSEIKKLFLAERSLAIDFTSQDSDKKDTELPFEQDFQSYQLDVYEIQEGQDLADSNGNVLEPKLEIIRFFNRDSYASNGREHSERTTKTEKQAYTVYKNIAIAIDNSSYKIPEVRAGPTA